MSSVKLIALRPGEASCAMCRQGPQGSNNCALKGSVQNAYLKQDRHDCPLFKHFSQAQVEKRRKRLQPPVEVDQPGLF